VYEKADNNNYHFQKWVCPDDFLIKGADKKTYDRICQRVLSEMGRGKKVQTEAKEKADINTRQDSMSDTKKEKYNNK
jgi:hypothetical protein